jgi:hypothetical protein
MVVVMVTVKEMEAGQVMAGASGCAQFAVPDCQLPDILITPEACYSLRCIAELEPS